MDALIKRFASAGLILQKSARPIGALSRDIFGIDIRRKFRGSPEYFVMWPGHESTLIQVSDVDKKRQQLVLLVKESAREFYTKIGNYEALADIRKMGFDAWRKANPDVAAYKKDGAYYGLQKSSGAKRCILLGVDERQLFMAQLPRVCTTVAQAHETLKATVLTEAEGRQCGKTFRQGEWFFLNITETEAAALSTGLRKNSLFIRKKVGIGEATGTRQGKPHLADEVVVAPAGYLEHGFRIRGRPDVFVRGSIKHPDHATIKFSSWRKVVRNNEKVADRGIAGGTWID